MGKPVYMLNFPNSGWAITHLAEDGFMKYYNVEKPKVKLEAYLYTENSEDPNALWNVPEFHLPGHLVGLIYSFLN
jgi:hypothetical protein